MIRILASILVVAGAVIGGRAAVSAVQELQGVYRHNLESPLDSPQVPDDDVSGRMLRALIPGAAGVVLIAIGAAMLRFGGFTGMRLRQGLPRGFDPPSAGTPADRVRPSPKAPAPPKIPTETPAAAPPQPGRPSTDHAQAGRPPADDPFRTR